MKTSLLRLAWQIGILTIVSLAPLSTWSSSYFSSSLPWQHFVVSIGPGFGFTSSLNKTYDYGIVDIANDEYYVYSPHHHTQTFYFVNGFFGMEWALPQDWLLQTGINLKSTLTPMRLKGSLTQGVDLPSQDVFNYYYDISAWQYLFEAKVIFPIQNYYPYFKIYSNRRLYPYLSVGVGESINRSHHYTTSVPFNLSFTREYASHTAYSFSYDLGIGMYTEYSDDFRFGLSYHFSDLGRVKLGAATIDGQAVNGTFSQRHMLVNELRIDLDYII